MRSVLKCLKENIILLTVSFMCFSSEPAIVSAQSPELNFLPFTSPLSLSRGTLSSNGSDPVYLDKAGACEMAIKNWGWDNCGSIDAMVFTMVDAADTVVISKPDSQGYVKLTDWDKVAERAKAVTQIESSMRISLKEQGAKLGQDISFEGWRTYPTLNKEKKYLYYATNSVWDGAPVTNIKATVFDRRGYVVFDIVPISDTLSSEQVVLLINQVLDLYTPIAIESYAAFENGDRIAAVGAIGILASLTGVKYGKAAATGIFAVLVVLLKKFFFLLILPIVWIGKLFRKKSD